MSYSISILIKHFGRKFNSQDENFWSEVKLLRKKSLAMAKECLVPGEHRDNHKKRTVSKLVLNPNIGQRKQRLCQDLVQDEDEYFNYFRGKQSNDQLFIIFHWSEN
ncbi:hypothetical protein OS493_010249 [Desmophyllum pertusum]|uniref:Uncharacterized protein n=1 Tax=Desmophyllum pertusum TaxID=174260 RepID=A0A9X0A368_9CNID|nr:hypothetical protein OS493_010249 [Desmophyllum pertusum]